MHRTIVATVFTSVRSHWLIFLLQFLLLALRNSESVLADDDETHLTENDFIRGRELDIRPYDEINDNSWLDKQQHFEGDIVGLNENTLPTMVEATNAADIVFKPLVQAKMEVQAKPNPNMRSAAVTSTHKLWDRGIVPYTISKRYKQKTRALIARAFEHIQNQTCIRFVERNASLLQHRFYIYIKTNLTKECASRIGRQSRRQIVALDEGMCFYKGTIGRTVHELLHALGFFHEHSRPDRDFYVKIIRQNIRENKETNFLPVKLSRIQLLDAPYDYGSIMHYKNDTWSKTPAGSDRLLTMIPTSCGGSGIVIGQAAGLSHYDVFKINKLYNCSVTPNDCINVTTNCAFAGSEACRNPQSYLGIKRTTVTGRLCQRWDMQTPHKHPYGNLYGSTNYCRNPQGSKDAPWCYTKDPKTTWEYCFSKCPMNDDHDVRLIANDGRIDQPYGRVQINHNSTWGMVHKNPDKFKAWDDGLAKVVCRMLGWTSDFAFSYNPKHNSPKKGPVWVKEHRCLGTESHVEDCLLFEFNNWKQNYTRDLFIRCYCPPSSSGNAEADFTKSPITTKGNLTVEVKGLTRAESTGYRLRKGNSIKLRFYMKLRPVVANLYITHPLAAHRVASSSHSGYPPIQIKINDHNAYAFHVETEDPRDRVDGAAFLKKHLKMTAFNEVIITALGTNRRPYHIQNIKIVWDLYSV